jgi:hypothetical protein
VALPPLKPDDADRDQNHGPQAAAQHNTDDDPSRSDTASSRSFHQVLEIIASRRTAALANCNFGGLEAHRVIEIAGACLSV